MNIRDGLSNSRGPVHWLVATLLASLVTAGLDLLHANSPTAGMVYLVLVVWSATQAGFVLSLYIAGLCAICFDFFFLIPYHTFILAGPQQWVDMFAFAACSVVVSRVAERARRQTRQAEQRKADVERLYALSQEMMIQEDAVGIMRDLPRLIARIFALDAVVLYVCDRDECYASAADLPLGLKASLHLIALEGLNPPQPVADGFIAMALALGLRPMGALCWRPAALSREVSSAVCAQVSIMLARLFALEAATRIEAAREGERLRTALVDSLTHELRTPLTSIRAAATTLTQAGGLDDEGRLDMAKIVDEESARLDRLIGDALEMAQIDAHSVEVRPAPIHPRALLEQAVDDSRSVLARHPVAISAGESADPVWLDARLLNRVLRHLLENAARYTPSGTHIRLISRRAAGRIEFTVEDDGPGIDAADLPLIFEKFYRGRRSTAGGKGSGMGLAIVRAILAEHGGAIAASSIPGKGTAFHFWLPLLTSGSSQSSSNE